MKFSISLSLPIIFFLFTIKSFAQLKQPVPKPQSIQLQNETLSLKDIFILTGSMTPSQTNIELLKQIFNISDNPQGKAIEINKSFFDNAHQQQSGAYNIIISSGKVTINAFDQRGLFYALQTLQQLITTKGNHRSLPAATISDYPDNPIRGTVEGFYGEPWTHQDRINQLKFYGKFKLNTYIYGPKDDPYHSSPNWRKPYPPEQEERIKALVEEAKRNYVDFVWAIHPGQDIRWTREDSLNIIVKFEWMYQLGVRNFAVFFDDISGVGTDAKRQAQLLNYILEAFVKPKKDIGSLIMCPTEYNKAWSNKQEGTYLDILGQTLDPSIYIMWTGNSVISDNTVEGLQWVNKRIKRKALVWWNFPVSDYVRDHLLMGPAYGLDVNAAPYMSGFVSNPMDKSEASKIALFGVAWYAWNTKSYDYNTAWEAANRYLMPEAPELFRLFNAHNSDLGPNGHGYRREESVQIKPVIDSFTTSLKEGNYRLIQAKKIKQLFDSITLAGEKIALISKNKRLIEQIQPWLLQFKLLGKAGSQGMQMLESNQKMNLAGVWNHYLELDKFLDSMNYVDSHYNQNPYQPGIKTGSLVLTPFVKNIQQTGKTLLLNKGNFGTANEPSQYSSVLKTNIKKLEQQPVLLNNTSVSISPVLEVIPIEKDEFAGIEIAGNLQAIALDYHLQAQNVGEWAQLQTSKDGENWQELTKISKDGKGKIEVKDEDFRFFRVINISGKKQSFFLKKFKVEIQAKEGLEASFGLDGSLDTYEVVSADKPLEMELPAEFPDKGIRILLKKPRSTKVVVKGYRKGFLRGRELYEGRENYIVIPPKKMKRMRNISINMEDGRVYEILAL